MVRGQQLGQDAVQQLKLTGRTVQLKAAESRGDRRERRRRRREKMMKEKEGKGGRRGRIWRRSKKKNEGKKEEKEHAEKEGKTKTCAWLNSGCLVCSVTGAHGAIMGTLNPKTMQGPA